MQASDLMRPPLDGYPSPLGNYQWMMIFLLRDHPNLVCGSNCLNKILNLEHALQTFDTIHFDDLPI